MREYPTHPRVDYAWYMKGLIDFERQPYKVERWLGVDMARRPPRRRARRLHVAAHRGAALPEERLRA
ncbi:MAG: tetratricopeptide repeat protein [Rhodanobacteraceae bacterium]|nr:tetratricopeptide repeat protein [Rhodanobacteraceae bacterium]